MLTLQVGDGSFIPTLEIESTLPFAELWDGDEEEEVFSHPTMETRELIIAEDPSLTMEDIFGDLHWRAIE